MPIVGANNSISGLGASTVDAVGDSTALDNRVESDGFLSAFTKRLSRRFIRYPQNAVGSSNLEAVQALIPDYATMAAADWMGHYPGHVLINAGISDIATTDIGGRVALMSDICDDVMAFGALPWLSALTPADNTSTTAEQERKWRIQLRNLGYYLLARQRGLPYLNGRQRIVDPDDGGWTTGYGSDALHANATGAAVHGWDMAQEVIDSQTGYPQTPWLVDANDTYSVTALKFGNPLFLTDTNADGTPDNWSGTTTTLTAPTSDEIEDGMIGNWLNIPSGTLTRTVTGFTAGNVIYLAWRYKYDYTSSTALATQRVRFLTSGAAVVGDAVDDEWSSPQDVDGIMSVTLDVPATADRISFSFGSSNGTLSIGQLTCVDLTAHGLDDYAFPAG
jgi:hypothetical protein